MKVSFRVTFRKMVVHISGDELLFFCLVKIMSLRCKELFITGTGPRSAAPLIIVLNGTEVELSSFRLAIH